MTRSGTVAGDRPGRNAMDKDKEVPRRDFLKTAQAAIGMLAYDRGTAAAAAAQTPGPGGGGHAGIRRGSGCGCRGPADGPGRRRDHLGSRVYARAGLPDPTEAVFRSKTARRFLGDRKS